MRTPFDQVFHYGQLPCVLQQADFDELADKAVRLKIGNMLLSATATRRAPSSTASPTPGGWSPRPR